jgi:hypothetical protein
MAQHVLVQLVDDLDGTSSADITTVRFGLDGVEYEIDVNAANAERLRKTFAEYAEAGRRTGGRLQRGTRPAGKAAGSGEAGQVREWALENGFELSGRGRIPTHVLEAYMEAQEKPKAKAAPKKRAARKG